MTMHLRNITPGRADVHTTRDGHDECLGTVVRGEVETYADPIPYDGPQRIVRHVAWYAVAELDVAKVGNGVPLWEAACGTASTRSAAADLLA